MKFLTGWTIDIKKIPKYNDFCGDFVMDLDYKLLKAVSVSADENFTDDRKLLLYPILEKMSGKNTLITQHNSRAGLGRFYPDQSISPICLSRCIKHTLFHHLDWIDLDMVKGHPSILSSIATKNKLEVPTFKEYIANPEATFKMLIDYYSIDESSILTDDDVKAIFNRTIYGGTHEKWVKDMFAEGKIVKTKPHPFVVQFITEVHMLIDIIFEANKDIASRVNNKKGDKDIKNTVMSYWCGTLENEILHVCYKHLLKCNFIKRRRNVALEYDGLCFKKPSHYDDSVAESIITSINDCIFQETGMSVTMKFKGYKKEHIITSVIESSLACSLTPVPSSVAEHVSPVVLSDVAIPDVTPEQLSSIYKLNPLFSVFTTGLIADIFQIVYGKKFKYVPDGKNGTMYHFNGIYWKPDSNLSIINSIVDKAFVKFLNVFAEKDRKKYTALLDDDSKKDNAANHIAAINKFVGEVNKRLRVAKLRADYINDIKFRLTDDVTEWNKKPFLYAFNNVIFDLKTGKQVDPNPDDFISITCGCDYDFTYDHVKNISELQAIINTILPQREIQDYYLEILASCLCGIQVQKVFIATGKGGNGKSLLNGLMLYMLGNYGKEVPAALLSQKIKDGPNPQAAALDGKRGVFASEPEKNEPLCCAALKPLTGESTLPVRECFSNKVGISLNLTLIISCNDKPLLDEVNDAVTRRMNGAVIPFKSKFATQQRLDEDRERNGGVLPDNHHIANEFYLTEEFKNMYSQALFHILLKKFPDYMRDKINIIPPEVLKLSSDYMAGSDNIYEWFLENYEKNPESMVLVDDVFYSFQCSQKFMQMNKLEKRNFGSILKFKEKLESNLFIGRHYRPPRKYWQGTQMTKPFIEGWQRIPNVDPEVER